MGETTKIEWTATYVKKGVMWHGEVTTVIPGATFNLVIGCQKVSPACKNCYAEALDKRWTNGKHWGPGSDRKQMSEAYWKQPHKWNTEAKKAGIMRKVFCSSLADWAEDHPQLVEPRKRLFKLIEETPNLIWLLLTKRPENILRFIPDAWKLRPPQNVWYGTTVESQEYVTRIEHLIEVPAHLRFVSCEPLFSALDIKKYLSRWLPYSRSAIFSDRMSYRGHIHWVIAGGESGHNSRPSHPWWFESLRNQCEDTLTPFLFKQWGEWQDGSNVIDHKYSGRHGVMLSNGDFAEWAIGTDAPYRSEIELHKKYTGDEWNTLHARVISRVGKKQAGRHLDQKLYNQMPDNFYG